MHRQRNWSEAGAFLIMCETGVFLIMCSNRMFFRADTQFHFQTCPKWLLLSGFVYRQKKYLLKYTITRGSCVYLRNSFWQIHKSVYCEQITGGITLILCIRIDFFRFHTQSTIDDKNRSLPTSCTDRFHHVLFASNIMYRSLSSCVFRFQHQVPIAFIMCF